MTWKNLKVSRCGTHHEVDGAPAYSARFDEVLTFHDPGLAPVRVGDAAWHVHADGRPAYARRFRRTFGYYEGLAAAVGEDGWRHVDPGGWDAYPTRYAWCGNFQGGRCAVRAHDGAYLHVTGAGEPAYAERWRYAGDYRDGVAVVQAESGRSTHIDTDGRHLHGHWFYDLDVFHKGFARARDERGWMHVDRGGAAVYARRFAAVEPFYNGQARVERFDGGLEVIDETGRAVLELRPPLRSEFAALSGDMVGFWKTQAIGAAVELGVIEALPGTSDEIAQRCDLHPERCRRLLRALGEIALVVEAGGNWNVTARGEYLRAAHPLTLADAAREYAVHFPRMWDALPETMKARGSWSAPDVFGEVARDQHRMWSHHRMLLSYARHDYPRVPTALGLRGDERVVDGGGGLGALAVAVLDAHPDIRMTVLDRPEVVAQAMQVQPERRGLEWRAGNLFESWGIEADAVMLARVLHDWDDEAAKQILRRAREALSRGGRIFVVEMLVPDNGVAGGLCDLHLLMATGGQERTATEYARLLEAAGFELREVRPLAALPSVLVGVAR